MRYSRKKSKPAKIKNRILLVGIFFSLLYAGIAARAVYLQVYCRDMLASKAFGEYTRTYVTSGKRGTIYDRNHTELAVTIDATSIGIHPSLIPNANEIAPRLARTLNMETKAVKGKLASRQPFVWLQRTVTGDAVEAVRQLGLPAEAVAYVPEQKRVYPNNSLAAQLIGFTGIDGNGLEGIEFTWDEYLRGSSVRQTVLMDAKQRRLGAGEEIPGCVDGHNVVLTIDGAIQYIAETALEKAVVDSDAAHGMAIVMDPHTGEILAMANYPFFDLNRFGGYQRDLWRNRVVADAFEPGSVMKVFLAAGSIESGLCTPDSVFDCENGAYRVHGHTINDTHRHGLLTVREIIKISSNIGAVKISEKIGRKALWETLRNFGFSTKPEVECPGNTEGRLSYYSQWTDVDMSAIAFGQGIAASAVQLVTAVSAIANGGLLMKPYVVSSVVSPDGQVARRRDREIVRRVISENTAEQLKEMMAGVTTEGGTGVNAAVEGYSVCGKTGTAQKLDKAGGYSNRDYVSSFLGFAPQNNPRIAVMVVVDSPRKAYYASVVAAPAFRKIVHETLNYFGVLPETDPTGKNLIVQVDTGGNG
jgi:cell division protein FtsI (penicillin-binding protein 3)